MPAALVGRREILDRMHLCSERLSLGRHAKSFFVLGLRGVGKTVLLNQMEKIAQHNQHHCVYTEIHNNKSLAELLAPSLYEFLHNLRHKKSSPYIQKAAAALKSFVKAFKIKYYDVELGIELQGPTPRLSTGDVELDLPALLVQIAQAAQSQKQALALVIDEMQLLSEKEISALIVALHRCAQLQLPLALVAAGLPDLLVKVGRSKSYAERLFDAVDIGSLSQCESLQALQKTAHPQGVQFEKNAALAVYKKTNGYPYFVQEWGYQAWNIAVGTRITLQDVKKATPAAINNLDKVFFKMRFERLSQVEKQYLIAMASMRSQPSGSGTIAKKIKRSPQQAAPIRAGLIGKGVIYSPARGLTDFTVPMFDTFIHRYLKK